MNTLLKQATEKGFQSEAGIFADLHKKDSIMYYLWLCELQLWILETHNSEAIVYRMTDCKTFSVELDWETDDREFETRREALETVLSEALNLINQ